MNLAYLGTSHAVTAGRCDVWYNTGTGATAWCSAGLSGDGRWIDLVSAGLAFVLVAALVS